MKYNYLISLLYFSLINLKCKPENKSNEKLVGYIPNAETATKIAEAVWLPIYGNEIFDEKPYIAKLNGNIWTVTGTLHFTHGGTAYIKIQRNDGKIITVGHQK